MATRGRGADQGDVEDGSAQEEVRPTASSGNAVEAEWYVLLVRPSKKRHVVEKFDALGVEVFVPMRVVWRKHRRKPRERVEYPLLENYWFIRGDLSNIFSIDGVIGILTMGDVWVAVKKDEVEKWQAWIAEGLYDETLQQLELLTRGQKVVWDVGPFKDHDAVITELMGDDIEVAMMLFGEKRTMRVPVDRFRKSI